ncbi:3712_t:CDS:1, partial [Rhizophagus irregularis]
EVKISLEEYELLIRQKKESNIESHQDKIKTFDEAKRDLEADFPDLKDLKIH